MLNNKLFKISIITVIILLIILIFFSIIYLINNNNQNKYEEFEKEMNLVFNKICEISEKQKNYGIKFNECTEKLNYEREISEIKEKYKIDILADNYYLLKKEDLQLLQISEVTRIYVVNYEENLVFTLEPLKYKNKNLYTIFEVEKLLKKEYAYDIPIIPNGFKHVEGSWNTGYVIEDENNNQFVWIPVGLLNNSKPSDAFKEYLYTRYKSKDVTEELTKIKNSIDKYGGFYIARYEASLKNELNDSTNILRIVKDVIPVTQVAFTVYTKDEENNDIFNAGKGYNEKGESVKEGERRGALELAQNMALDYDWDNNGIHTSLIYGEHYDTTLAVLIKLGLFKGFENEKSDAIKEDSTLWGNYSNSEFTYIVKNEEYEEYEELKKANEGILLPTGIDTYRVVNNEKISNNKIFNIYDLAGNVAEWVYENNVSNKAVIRGGSYINKGTSGLVAEYTNQYFEYASYNIGIRVIMYID